MMIISMASLLYKMSGTSGPQRDGRHPPFSPNMCLTRFSARIIEGLPVVALRTQVFDLAPYP